jgi:SAM-dependent methyltransferase
MQPEPRAIPHFYESPTGRMAARILCERIGALWPDLAARRVLGLGWTAPFLPLWQGHPERLCALIPAELGAAGWPVGQEHPAGQVAVGEEERLPFADLAFDRVLVVHGLEASGSVRRMLREVWRVLADDGVALFVVPNRRGLWAHLERTPFGHGHPYSQGQLSRLLARHLFTVERAEAALFCPPFPWRPLLAGAPGWERAGRWVAPALAGVVLVEARKSVLGALPVPAALARRPATARAARTEAARRHGPEGP